MNWTIRNMDYEVKEEIVRRSRNAQMSIAEFFAAYFIGKEPQAPKNDVWYIRDVDHGTKVRLKKLAATKGQSIGQVLSDLITKNNPNEVVIDSQDLKEIQAQYEKLGTEIKKIVDNPK